MENYVVTLRLIDGSTHETVVPAKSLDEVVTIIDEYIGKNKLIQTRDSKYGEIFGRGYVYGENIISFHISSLNAEGKGIKNK